MSTENENQKQDLGTPIKGPKGEIVAWHHKEHGIAFDSATRSDEQNRCVCEYINNLNQGIYEENLQKITEFRNSSAYQELNEEDRIVAEYRFQLENCQPSCRAEFVFGSYDNPSQYGYKVPQEASPNPMEAFQQTERYQQMNDAEKIIAYGEFYNKVYGREYNAVTFADLKQEMDSGKFNYSETKVAADYMREHYRDGYDADLVETNAILSEVIFETETKDPDSYSEETKSHLAAIKSSPLLHLSSAGKRDDEAVELAWRGHRTGVDASVTRSSIDAVEREPNVSDGWKDMTQLQEVKDYCMRINNAPDITNDSEKAAIMGNVLRYHPELAQQLLKEYQQNPESVPFMNPYLVRSTTRNLIRYAEKSGDLGIDKELMDQMQQQADESIKRMNERVDEHDANKGQENVAVAAKENETPSNEGAATSDKNTLNPVLVAKLAHQR